MGMKRMRLVDRLIFERDRHIDHALFYWTQIQLSYNSNHMEGSTLTPAQTAQIYETGRFLADKPGEQLNIDDAIETANHFDAFNFMLDHADEPVDKELVCSLHATLKRGTKQSKVLDMNMGEYKRQDNEIMQVLGVSAAATAPAAAVPALMEQVFAECASLNDDHLLLAQAHWMFEKVHPFSDGNGRVGRLVLFKECLRLNTVPPIIRDEHHNLYTSALDQYPQEPGWLVDLMASERDAYRDGFMSKMAPGEIDYTYHDSWNAAEHEDDLARAAGFRATIARLARQAHSGRH